LKRCQNESEYVEALN